MKVLAAFMERFRCFIPLVFAICLAIAPRIFAQQAEPTPIAVSSPAPAAATPSRETLASAPAGYLPPPAATPALKLGYNSVNVDGPYIAITFDDGPHSTLTPLLLQRLAERRIKATFFMVGTNVAEFPDIVKRIAADGHEVANHSWSHPNLAKMSEEAVRAQLEKTNHAIAQACGITPKTMRPPYGSITDRQRSWITNSLGMKVIMWSLDPLDWKDRSASTVARRIITQTQPGAIILAHDIHPTTVEAMPEVFDALLARNFKFVTVSELLAMEKPPAPKPTQPAGEKDLATGRAEAESGQARPSGSAQESSPAPLTQPTPRSRRRTVQ